MYCMVLIGMCVNVCDVRVVHVYVRVGAYV